MNIKSAILLLLVSATITSCIPLFYPLIADEQAEKTPEIIGLWTSKEDNSTWNFGKTTDTKYKLTYTKKSHGTQVYTCNFGRIGEVLFMDSYPNEDGKLEDINSFKLMHSIGAHAVMKVEFQKNKTILTPINFSFLDKIKESGDPLLKVIENDGQSLIISTTDELRKIVDKYKDQPEFYGEKLVLTKQAVK